jgi:hypothetical protein
MKRGASKRQSPMMLEHAVEMAYRVSWYRPCERPRSNGEVGDAGTQFGNRLRSLIFRICTVPRSGGDGAQGLRKVGRHYNDLASPAFPSPLKRRDSFRKATPSHLTASAARRSEHDPSVQRDRLQAPLRRQSSGRKSLSGVSPLERHCTDRPSRPDVHSLVLKATGCAQPGVSPLAIGSAALFAVTQELLS